MPLAQPVPEGPPAVVRALATLHAHYDAIDSHQGVRGENLSLGAAAASLGISRSSLQRAFRAAGTTFAAERMGVRMRLAMQDALTSEGRWYPKGFARRYGYSDGIWNGYPAKGYQPESGANRFSKAFYTYWGLSVVEVQAAQRLRLWTWTTLAKISVQNREPASLTKSRLADAQLRLAAFTSAISITGTDLDDIVASFATPPADALAAYRSLLDRPLGSTGRLRGKYPQVGKYEMRRLTSQGLLHRLTSLTLPHTTPSRATTS